MRCMHCQTPIGHQAYCETCGRDIHLLRDLRYMSSLYYNQALDKAKVRDLTGARELLKKSLWYDKENMHARNLLGLVYFEVGEVVSALSEWVISRHLMRENNPASRLIDELQSNMNKLATINQTIKKYNQCLSYCHEDSEDLAIIQLKKILRQNPRLIRAYQLLALLYMKEERYEKAKQCIKRGLRVDGTNTLLLRYMQEIYQEQGARKKTGVAIAEGIKDEEQKNHLVTYYDGNDLVIHPATYRDYSGVASLINIVIGIVVGAAVIAFLVVPQVKRGMLTDNQKQLERISTELATAQAEKVGLRDQLAALQGTTAEQKNNTATLGKQITQYDSLVKLAAARLTKAPIAEQADLMGGIDPAALTAEGKATFDKLKSEMSEELRAYFAEQAAAAMSGGDYETAVNRWKSALSLKEDYTAYLNLAKAYKGKGDQEAVTKTLATIKEKYPESAEAAQAELQ
ncbi:MAG: hypothetical protein SPL15_05465 [Lachnospiraceae bacterium]|nr:hypothetical protein [Lachnospiraceae bacterium]MDY5742427.1 hypothetical protein [Lachnospiraceae bacterium]